MRKKDEIPNEVTVTLTEKQFEELKESVTDAARNEISSYIMILNKALDNYLKRRDSQEKQNSIKIDLIRKMVNENDK